MGYMRRFWIGFVLMVVVFFAVAAGVMAQSAAQDSGLAVADPLAGRETFLARCANCHGPQGLGDGELAENLPNLPTALGDVAYLRGATPAGLFDTISNGRAQNGMPPFGEASSNPLSEAERWNLVAAIYELGVAEESVAAGEAIYQESCLACHTSAEIGERQDITDPFYLLDRSNQALFEAMSDGAIAEHDLGLDEASLWSVADYLRTFSTVFVDPLAPIELATIAGLVMNGTTGEPAGAGLLVELNAFSPDFGLAFTETATVAADGSYQFALADVSPDLVFATIATYEGVQFGTDFGLLERNAPEIELPLTVYEPTTDPAGVTIDQLHVVVEFVEGAVEISELYQFSQNEAAVYVGPTGDVAGGTVTFSLPAGAENPAFDRSFGSLDNLFPADDMLPTATGWAEVVPLRPGQGTLSLLLRYSLPYDRELTVAHPVDYGVANVNLVLVEAGVRLVTEGVWLADGVNSAEGFLGYSQAGFPAGTPLSFTLEGQPTRLTDTAGNAVLARNTTTELYIGAGILLIVLAGVAYWTTTWQQPVAGVESPGRDSLLAQIATLDDQLAGGTIDPATHRQQRQTLKATLLDIWEQ